MVGDAREALRCRLWLIRVEFARVVKREAVAFNGHSMSKNGDMNAVVAWRFFALRLGAGSFSGVSALLSPVRSSVSLPVGCR
jgi:hypothetical protein